ncbi:MAG: hypothetical protein JXC36_08695 [Candidatus Atribacteria bacterium]|nr:hypothetical protein [Candidatus Atribacteria bacterium]
MKRIKTFFGKLKVKFTKKKLKVVYENDVPSLFSSLKIYDKVQRGEIKCANCNNPITIENFAYLQIKDGKIQLICNNADCMFLK